MSAPSLAQQRTQFLDFGFLAAKAEKAAFSLAAGEPLSSDEIAALLKASEFLQQVAQGAKALSSGNFHGASNLRSAMDALELAIDPLEKLSAALQEADLADRLNHAAESVAKQIEKPGERAPSTADERRDAELFGQFFDQFYVFVRAQMTQMNKSPVLGDKTRFEGMAALRLH